MNLFVKAAGDLPFFEKAFFRNAVAIVFAGVILYRRHIPLTAGKGHIPLIVGRSLFGTIGIFCNFYAIDHLAISDASMLNKLSPFFAILFSIFLLQERPKGFQIACVAAAMLGTLFILKPSGTNLSTVPALIGMLGGAAAGLAYTLLRKATGQGVPGPFIVFFFSAFSCLCCLPLSILYFQPMTLRQLLLLLLSGLCASGGQFSITAAYTHAKASEISVYDYTQVLFAGVLGWLFLHEIPDCLSLIGYIIIIGASVTMFVLLRSHAKTSQN